MRRRTRWILAVVGVVLMALASMLCIRGGWRPLGGDEKPPIASIPGDVDVACLLDARALRAAPLLHDESVASALAEAADLPSRDVLTDPMLGDQAAFAMRDGSWLAVIRVSGPIHGARIGIARWFVTMEGDGPVFEATTPDDDTLYVARHANTWIVSDDEELAEDALACAAGTGAPVSSRLDLEGAFDGSHNAGIWVSDDAASYVRDALEASLRESSPAMAKSLDYPDSACAVSIDIHADKPAADAVVVWRGRADSAVDLKLHADLAEMAKEIEDDAEKAPPPAPRNEPSDRVRLTIELSKGGLSGQPLRDEVARRAKEMAEARVAKDAAAILSAARQRAALMRALGRLDAHLTVNRGATRLALTISR